MAKVSIRVAYTLIFVIAVFQSNSTFASDATADQDVDSRLDTLFGSHDSVKQFLTTLKVDSTHQRWTAIAALIAYPIKIKIDGHRIQLHNPSEFAAHHAELLTPKVLAAIEHQTYSSLFANDKGVMIGEGEVWFSPICSGTDCNNAPLKITGINP